MDTAAATKAPRPRRYRHAAGYLLASRETEAVSLRADIAQYCTEKGFSLDGIYEDSASKYGRVNFDERPGAARLLKDLKPLRLRHIIIPRLHMAFPEVADMAVQLDRLHRRGRHLHILQLVTMNTKAGAHNAPFGTDTDPAGIFWRTVTAIGRIGKHNMREQLLAEGQKPVGYLFGGVPYGFDRRGTLLVRNDSEQAVIRRIRGLLAQGLALNAVAKLFNSEAIPTKKPGGKWYASSIYAAAGHSHTAGEPVDADGFTAVPPGAWRALRPVD